MAAMSKLLTLWMEARLADKDGFLLLIGGGSIGMPWWNAEHVHNILTAWKAIPRHEQDTFLAYAVNEIPEVKNEG
jgi:hypothetical protein